MLSIIEDKVALWTSQMMDGIMVRPVPLGTKYLPRDSMVYKETTQPMWRYVKNYERGKGKNRVKFCLFVRSFEGDEKFVETELDRIAGELSDAYIKEALSHITFESFVYTDYFINKKEGE